MKVFKSYRTIPGYKRPVRCWTMATLLIRFGLSKLKKHRAVLAGDRKNPYALWDEVRSHWRRVRRLLHPDSGGCEKTFAWFSSIYDEIKRRLRLQGVLT